MSDDPRDDDYTPPWRRGTVSMENGSAPSFNAHMPQVKPRDAKRSEALDALIEQTRKGPQAKPSGHSLIR